MNLPYRLRLKNLEKFFGQEHLVGHDNILRKTIEARKRAYHAMSLLSVEGNNLHFRTDIGWRDVERLRK